MVSLEAILFSVRKDSSQLREKKRAILLKSQWVDFMAVAIRRSLGFAAGMKMSKLAIKEDLLKYTSEDWKRRLCMRRVR